MKKLFTLSFFVMSVFLTPSLFAQQLASLEIGSVKSVLNDLKAQNTRATLSYRFPTPTNKQIEVSLADYYYKNNQLSMSGEVKGNENSLFIFKGDDKQLYGYVAMHDTKKAYEYTTNTEGIVVVNEVPIAKIFPDLYTVDMQKPADGPRAKMALEYSKMALGQMPHIGEYSGQNINDLQSLPGAKLVFYCDITRVMNGDTPKHISKAEMYKAWQCLADQLSMYQINVTTNRQVYDAAGVPNSGIIRFRDEDGRSNAPLNSFGTTRWASLYRVNEGYGYGRTNAHEVGHQLGLSHDGGQPGGEYYEGIPEYEWCPIMGNYWFGNRWDQALYQYSKGEYSGASQRQDDLQVIKRYLPFREDDIPTSKALVIGEQGVISPEENWGQIETNTDNDAFDFEIGAETQMPGHLTLKLDAIEFISMLDIEAEIQKEDGTVVVTSNLDVNRSAEFDKDLAPGKYKLVIRGGAEGTPQKGFSTYSSLGVYAMEGKITGAVITDIPKSTLERSVSVFPVPANDVIHINIPREAQLKQIQITSALGKVVYNSTENLNNINVSHLATGVYFMRMKINDEHIVKKFTKK